MSHPFDATLKELVAGHPDDYEGAFGMPKGEPARLLNVDVSTVTAATDVALGFGDPLREIVDLNFQSGPDATLPARLLLYNAALHLRHGIPVRSLLVLLRPKANAKRLSGKLGYTSGGSRVEFVYETIRLWRQPVEPFLQGGVGLLPLATLCELPKGEPESLALKSVIRRIDERLSRELDQARAVRLMTAAYVLANLRAPKDSVDGIFEGVQIMHKMAAYDEYVQEGEIRGKHQMLLKLGQKILGRPEAETKAAVLSIRNPKRLDRLVVAALTASSWQDLLSTR